MLLECVVHSWQFSRLLVYHLSSFLMFPPKRHNVRVTVCFCPDDRETANVLRYIAGQETPNHVSWHWLPMARENVCNRTIGRNVCALKTRADWVWFADADYVVGDGFLDAMSDILYTAVPEKVPLVYPTEVLACPHDVGAKLISQSRVTTLGIPYEHFVPHGFNRAIGGVQFARGSVCRSKGYCNGDGRSLQPSPDGWLREISDSRFRRSLECAGYGVRCAGLYRIRHKEDTFDARKKRADGSPT